MMREKRKMGKLNQENIRYSKSKIPVVILVTFLFLFLLVAVMAIANVVITTGNNSVYLDAKWYNSFAVLVIMSVANIAFIFLAVTWPRQRMSTTRRTTSTRTKKSRSTKKTRTWVPPSLGRKILQSRKGKKGWPFLLAVS
jgi:uncharacterized integral membrane protein